MLCCRRRSKAQRAGRESNEFHLYFLLHPAQRRFLFKEYVFNTEKYHIFFKFYRNLIYLIFYI